MASGTRTLDKDLVEVADEYLVHRTAGGVTGLRRQSADDLAAQVLASPAVSDALAAAAEGDVAAETWTALAEIIGARVGQKAEVEASDGGSHTDPVVGGTVFNAGRYRWSEAPDEGWLRIGDLRPDASAVADDLAAYEASTDAALGLVETEMSDARQGDASLLLALTGIVRLKASIDCSANPNYPAARRGDGYVVTVAGRIGGSAGLLVAVGDIILCLTNGTASNTHASVGAQWQLLPKKGSLHQGNIDCSTNPNYPAANQGWTWRVSVAGKIGGASGLSVEIGDLIYTISETQVSGDHAAVGSSYMILQGNVDGGSLTALVAELTTARGGEATVGARLDKIDYAGEVDRGGRGGFLSRDENFGGSFGPGSAFQIHPLTGRMRIAAFQTSDLAARVVTGNLRAAHRATGWVEHQITFSGDVVEGSAWCDEHWVHFTRYHAGQLFSDAIRLSSLNGDRSLQAPGILSGITKMLMAFVTGQSPSVGGAQTLEPISTVPLDPTRVFGSVAGARPLDWVLVPRVVPDYDPGVNDNERNIRLTFEPISTLVPLYERRIGPLTNAAGETPCSGIALELYNRRPSNEAIWVSCHGVGATRAEFYDDADDIMMDNLLKTAESVAAALCGPNIPVEFVGIFDKGGEGDATLPTAKATFKARKLAMATLLDTRLRAISGQSKTVPLIFSQVASATKSAITSSPIPIAMAELARENPGLILVSDPGYQQVHHDGIHMQPIETKVLGQFPGRVMAAVADGSPGAVDAVVALRCLSATATGTAFATVWDRSSLASIAGSGPGEIVDPGQLGLRIIVDSGGPYTLTFSGIAGSTINWTLSGTLTAGQNPKLGIADAGTSGANAGPATGQRACVVSTSADTAHDGRPMPYYAQIDQIPITVI